MPKYEIIDLSEEKVLMTIHDHFENEMFVINDIAEKMDKGASALSVYVNRLVKSGDIYPVGYTYLPDKSGNKQRKKVYQLTH